MGRDGTEQERNEAGTRRGLSERNDKESASNQYNQHSAVVGGSGGIQGQGAESESNPETESLESAVLSRVGVGVDKLLPTPTPARRRKSPFIKYLFLPYQVK